MKKFLIVGNANAITYKEVFPHIVTREIFVRTRTGTVHFGMWFHTNGGVLKEAASVWFTTLDSRHLYKTLELTKTYDPEKYPVYDNYNAIEVGRLKDIPKNYKGVMGVPISIVLFSPEQFKILDAMDYAIDDRRKNKNSTPQTPGETFTYVNGKKKYARVFNEHSSEEPDIINGGVFNNPYVDGKKKYQRLLIKNNDMKKFLIIGNLNAVTYKETFPLLKENKVWMGATCFNGGATHFIAPNELYDPEKMSNEKNAFFNDKGEFMWRVNGVRWFTNLDHKKRHEPIDLYKHYDEQEYPKYDNYDAIEVSKVCEIPMDYDGVMGVPITFLDKYCPEQFEIIGITENADYLKPLYVEGCEKYDRPYLSGKRMYSRILIKKR